MTLEELSLLRELLDLVKEVRNVCYELRGYLGYRPADAETTIAGGNVTAPEAEAEDFAHEVQEAPKRVQMLTKPYHAIKDIVAGMANIDMFGEIIRIFPVNSFTYNDGKPGRVMNVNLSDGTGVIKLCLWNDQIDKFARYNVGDWIEVRAEECKWDKSKVPKLQLLLGKSGSVRAKGQERL